MECSAIILAGGRGSRVGGADKGLLPYCERPLIEHVLDRIAPQVENIVISANRNRERYRQLGYRVVADEMEGFQGPLAGILAGLRHLDHELVLVAPCDMPKLPLDLAARLMEPLATCDVSYAFDGSRDQYLAAAIHRSLATDLARFLSTNQRSVRDWYAGLRCVRVDFSDQPDAFVNINREA